MSTQNLQDCSLHDLFRMEAEGQRQVLTDGLLVLERTPTSAVELEACMRAAHSLKGAARIVGLTAAVQVAHAMEDCLVQAQQGEIVLDHGAIDALLRGVDLLGRIADTPAAQAARWSGENVPDAAEFRRALEHALAPGEAPGSVEVSLDGAASAARGDAAREVRARSGHAPEVHAPEVHAPEGHAHRRHAPQGLGREDQANEGQANEGQAHERHPHEEERVLRIAASNLHQLLGLAGETLVESRWLDPYLRSLGRLKHLQREAATALDRFADHAPLLGTDAQAAALLLQARHALTECQRQLAERVGQLDMFERRLGSVAHRLYEAALASHMRPFADGTRGFKRLVRDLARELGRQARLEIVGSRTPVDRDVLASLEAPLGHLLRNAVDHGIEPAAQRQAQGKPAEGAIRLEAHHVSGLLEINISDDGRGIDLEQVRRVVVARGLSDAATAQRFTDAELLEFLFLPGFTVKDVVTEISGRGVGLDAVQNMVKQLRGSVRVNSQPGQGTRFQLHLPLTTSVLRALVVDIGGEPYAFPLAHIACTAMVPREQVQWLEGRQYFTLGARQVGLVPAQQVLDGQEVAAAPEQLQVVVLGDRARQHEYGLAVDRFRGVCELVVQPLDPRLGKVKDISAGALLDDGSPVLIVDVEDLVRSVERLVSSGRLAQVRCEDGGHARARKRVLVVDDSLTVRELERKLIESGGYAVEVAVDGMDGWNAVRLGQFDLVVTDIDMPRMDGIELVALIKKDPRLRSLPVMVVSYKDREEDRRRGLDAGADFYLTKGGFHEETLLQAVIDLIGEAA